jgi:hypothetical protein
MNLRVVLVGPLPPPSGGMANQTRQLARLLGESGADCAPRFAWSLTSSRCGGRCAVRMSRT